MRSLPAILFTTVCATVGGVKTVDSELDFCERKEVKVTPSFSGNPTLKDVAVLSDCGDDVVIEEYSCEEETCEFTTIDLRNGEKIKDFEATSDDTSHAIAHISDATLAVRIQDQSLEYPVEGGRHVHIIEKDTRTHFVVWSEKSTNSSSMVSFKLFKQFPDREGGVSIRELYSKTAFPDVDVDIFNPKVIFIEKHDVFLITGFSKRPGYSPNLSGFLVNAETGAITTDIRYFPFSIIIEFVPTETYDITLLADGETVAVSKMMVRSANDKLEWKIRLSAIRVMAADQIQLRTEGSDIDFPEEVARDILHLPHVAMTSLTNNYFVVVFHAGDSFNFVRGHLPIAAQPVAYPITQTNAGTLPFTTSNPVDLTFDVTGTDTGVFMVYAVGTDMFAFNEEDILTREIRIPETAIPTALPTAVPPTPSPVTEPETTESPLRNQPVVKDDDDDDSGVQAWVIGLSVAGGTLAVLAGVLFVRYYWCRRAPDLVTDDDIKKHSEGGIVTINMNNKVHHQGHDAVNSLPEQSL